MNLSVNPSFDALPIYSPFTEPEVSSINLFSFSSLRPQLSQENKRIAHSLFNLALSQYLPDVSFESFTGLLGFGVLHYISPLLSTLADKAFLMVTLNEILDIFNPPATIGFNPNQQKHDQLIIYLKVGCLILAVGGLVYFAAPSVKRNWATLFPKAVGVEEKRVARELAQIRKRGTQGADEGSHLDDGIPELGLDNLKPLDEEVLATQSGSHGFVLLGDPSESFHLVPSDQGSFSHQFSERGGDALLRQPLAIDPGSDTKPTSEPSSDKAKVVEGEAFDHEAYKRLSNATRGENDGMAF